MQELQSRLPSYRVLVLGRFLVLVYAVSLLCILPLIIAQRCPNNILPGTALEITRRAFFLAYAVFILCVYAFLVVERSPRRILSGTELKSTSFHHIIWLAGGETQTLEDPPVVGKSLATRPAALPTAPPKRNNPPDVTVSGRLSPRHVERSLAGMPVAAAKQESPSIGKGKTGVTPTKDGLFTAVSDARPHVYEGGNGGRGRTPSPVDYFRTETHVVEVPTAAPTVGGGVAPIFDQASAAKSMKTPATEPIGTRTAEPTDMPTGALASMQTGSRTPMPTVWPTRTPTTMQTEMPAAITTRTSAAMQTRMIVVDPEVTPTAIPMGTPAALLAETPVAELTGTYTAMPTGTYTAMPTGNPTAMPTATPTAEPTDCMEALPKRTLTAEPTGMPAIEPTEMPEIMSTKMLVPEPTRNPQAESTGTPIEMPTGTPLTMPPRVLELTGTLTTIPTATPTAEPADYMETVPTRTPTAEPIGMPAIEPTETPEIMSTKNLVAEPTENSEAESTGKMPELTGTPTTIPTAAPTAELTDCTETVPTRTLTAEPMGMPAIEPTETPEIMSTETLVAEPTRNSEAEPTGSPLAMPTETPLTMPPRPPELTGTPTSMTTESPTNMPTKKKTVNPTEKPAAKSTEWPAPMPTKTPTPMATEAPAAEWTVSPVTMPIRTPTAVSTGTPVAQRKKSSTIDPTQMPGAESTVWQATMPTRTSTPTLTETPVAEPTRATTTIPTKTPQFIPTGTPTVKPTAWPTIMPTRTPTAVPTSTSTASPTTTQTATLVTIPEKFTLMPTGKPSAGPTETPTAVPTPTPVTGLRRSPAPSSPNTKETPASPPDTKEVPAPSPPSTKETPTPSTSTKETPATAPVETAVPDGLLFFAPTVAPNTETPVGDTLPEETPPGDASGSLVAGAVSLLAAGGVVLAIIVSTTRNKDGSGSPEGESGNASSTRSPSATLVVVAVTQIQFIATVSLASPEGDEGSTFFDFADNLSWANLWPPDSFAEEFIDTSEEKSRRLDEEESSSGCTFAGNEASNTLVFIGNLGLVVGVLLAIFVLHVTLVSGVQAYWLAKQRAKTEIEAQRRGVPVLELSPRHLGERFESVDTDPSISISSSDSGLRRRITSRESSRRDRDGLFGSEDEERGGRVSDTGGTVLASPVAECRHYSNSAWLHFPHIELLFLFFAFNGAVASQLSGLREKHCPAVVFTAAAALLMYPVLMFAMICRTLLVRVLPGTLIVFKPTIGAEDTSDGSGEERSFFAKVKAGWDEDQSIFAWGKKGEWETVETTDDEARREGDWFRIGFEPLFVDFTKDGSWFVMLFLLESAAAGLVGVFVDNSVLQLLLFGGLNLISFVVLITLKPFSNSAVNAMEACLLGVDAACMALLAAAALLWKESAKGESIYMAVMMMQVSAVVGLLIPIYVDASLIIMGAFRRKMQKVSQTQRSPSQTLTTGHEERAFVRRYIRQVWAGIWCTMLRSNAFACVRDTSDGVRQPRNFQLSLRDSGGVASVFPSPSSVRTPKSAADDARRWRNQRSM